jgi:hypothetical protein
VNARRALRLHVWAFVAGSVLLIALNWLTGGWWWSFWPIAAWAIAFTAHYLVYKARSVDERWVEERTDELHSKSYDAGHIDAIKKDPPG